MPERKAYDEVLQVTMTGAQKKAFEEVALVRHPQYSMKHKRNFPNLAKAGREAIAEYIQRHRGEQ